MISLTTKQKAIAWKHGLLSKWKLRPHQEALHAVLTKAGRELVVLNVARKNGKSTACVVYALEQAIQKKQHIRYATAFLTDLVEFIIPIFDMMLADCPLHLKAKYKASSKTYHFPNGSVIKLVGLDKNKNGLRGNIIDILFVDEAGFVSNLEYLYKSVIIPATRDRPFKLIFPSTPPETPEHFWAKELILKAKLKGTYIEQTIDADPNLAPEERKRLLDEAGGEESATAQREYFCRIIVDSTKALAPEFSEAKHVRTIERPDRAIYFLSGDLGGKNDSFAIHLCCYDFKRAKVLFLDERFFPPQTSSLVVVAALREMEGKTKIRARWIDSPGTTAVDWAKDYQYPTVLPIKDHKEVSANRVRLALMRDEVEIDPKCKMLILTLLGGTWNNTRSDWAHTPALGHMDAFDSFIYGTKMVIKSNPYPLHDGKDPNTHHIPSSSPARTTSQQTLLDLFKVR